jgi:hypothetical protein
MCVCVRVRDSLTIAMRAAGWHFKGGGDQQEFVNQFANEDAARASEPSSDHPVAGNSAKGLPAEVLEVLRKSYLHRLTFTADYPDSEFLDDGDSVVL